MKAILWDGYKQIKGELIIQKKRLQFKLADFSETDLDFDLAYQEIKEINYYKLYKISNEGLEIISEQEKRNVFIVEQPQKLKEAIEVRMRLYS